MTPDLQQDQESPDEHTIEPTSQPIESLHPSQPDPPDDLNLNLNLNPNPPNPLAPTPPDHPPHDPDFRTLKLVLLSIFTMIFVPANAWLAHSMSPKALLDGYIFGFCFSMYSLAAVILVLGILVPPVMVMHWVWEVCFEVVPVE